MESSYPGLQMDSSFFKAQTDTSFFETHRNLFSETEYAEARKDMEKQEHYDMLSIVRTSKGKYVPLAIYQKITGDYRTVPGAVPPKPVINPSVVNAPENSVNMAKTTRKGKGKGRPAKSRQKSKKRSTSEEPSTSSSAATNELINGLFYVAPHVIDRLRDSNNPKTTMNVPDSRPIATNRRVNCPAPMVSSETNIDTARAPQEPQWDNNLYAESQQQQDFGSSSASSSSSSSTRQQQVQGPSAFESESVPWTTAEQHENKDRKGKGKQKETTTGASVGHDPEAKNGFDAPIEIYNLQDQWSGDVQNQYQYQHHATPPTTDNHETPESNSVPWTTADQQENKDLKDKGKAKETTSPWIEDTAGAKNTFEAPVKTHYPEDRWKQGTQYEYHPQPQAFGSEITLESTPWIASARRENNARKETETARTAWVEDLAEDEVMSDAPAEEYHPQVSWQNTTQSQYEYRPQPQEIGDQDVIMHQDYPMYQEHLYNPERAPNTEWSAPPKFAPIPQAAPISETPIFAAPPHTVTLMPEAPRSNEPPTSFIAPTIDCDVEMDSVEACEPIPWTLPTWQSVREERAPAPVPVPPIIPQAFPEPFVCYEPVFIPQQQAIQAKIFFDESFVLKTRNALPPSGTILEQLFYFDMSKNEFIDPKLVVCAAPWMLLCAYDTGLGHWVSLQPILAEWPTPVMPPLQVQESKVPPAAKHVCSEPQPDKENVAFQDGLRSYSASRFRISHNGGRIASFRGFVAPKIPSLSQPVRFNRMKPEQAYEFSKSFKKSQQATQRGRGKKVAFVLPGRSGEHEETRKPLRCLPLSPRSRRLNLHTDIPTSRPDVVSSPVEWPWNIRWIRPIAGFFGWV